MIRKKELIEMVQMELAGGDAPMDIRGKYHPLMIQKIIDMVYSDIVNSDPTVASDIAMDYAVTMSQVANMWQGTLSTPTIGSFGVIEAKFGNSTYYPTDVQEFAQLSKISIQHILKVQGGTKITLSKKPDVLEGTVTMIPLFSSMKSTDVVIIRGKESALFKAVFDLIRRDTILKEKLNNSRVDG